MDEETKSCIALVILIAVFMFVGLLVTWGVVASLIWLAALLFGG